MLPSRFATFELLRIITPGIYFAVLVLSLSISFEIDFHDSIVNDFPVALFFVVSLIAGLSFYAKESPKKRRAFQTNQPSVFLLDRSRENFPKNPLTDDDARRLYFYILNHKMPPTVHDKIFFFGMIYHIMINIRRTSFWFGIIGSIGIIAQIGFIQQTTISAISTVILIWFVYGINVRYNKADRKMQENYQDQIFWLEMNKEIVDSLIAERINKK